LLYLRMSHLCYKHTWKDVEENTISNFMMLATIANRLALCSILQDFYLTQYNKI
jgi:hypothetical protein